MIERRGFIVSGVAVLLTPLAAAEAQHAGKVYRIGYLASSGNPRVFDTFREGLRDLGWTEGQNIVIDYRSRRASSTVFPPSQPNWSG